VQINTAAFLLARGPHAYIGYGQWGMVWPDDPVNAPLPAELFQWDYGVPDSHCHRVDRHTWARHYTAGTVTVNCRTFDVILPHIKVQ
jgi:hypothetical protein